MEDILVHLAMSGGTSMVVFLLLLRMNKTKIEEVEKVLERHIDKHDDFEKTLSVKITQIYERLNPMSNDLSEIKGYMRGKNAKSI